MDRNFAELIDEAARDLGLNDYQLSAAIGLLSGNRVYHPKQVHRLRNNEVRHPDPELVERLIVVLHLDAAEAFAAARVLPAGVDAAALRKLDIFATPDPVPAVAHGEKVIGWYPALPGHSPVLVPVPDDLGELIEPLRHPGDRRLKPRPPAILEVFEVAA